MLLIDLRLLANITDKLFLSGTAIGKFKPDGYYWESFPRFASFDMMSGYVYTKNANKNGPFSCKHGKWAGERGQQEAFTVYMGVLGKKNIPVRQNRRRKTLGNPVFLDKRLLAIGIYT